MPAEKSLADALEEIRERESRATLRRPIPGYDGYEADDSGQIWSVASNWRGYGSRRMTQHVGPDGYMRVRVRRDGKRVTKSAHVLVALAFHGQPKPTQQVRHLDGNALNNAPDNLAWGTAKENADDRERHGRTAWGDRNPSRAHPERLARGDRSGARLHPDKVVRGIRAVGAKLDDESVRQIRKLHASGMTATALGAQFAVDRTQIMNVVNRRSWAHVA